MNPWKGLGQLPRPVWIVFAATLVNRAGTMVLPFLVLYLTRERGFTASQAGFVLASYGVGALIIGPLGGRLCDRIGAIHVLEASLLSSGVVVILLPLARGYVAIVGIVLLWALCGEASRPASLTVVTDLAPPGQRKTAVALVRLAVNLGMSIGPAAGGFLSMVSFPTLFVVDGATSIAAGGLLAASRWKKRAGMASAGTALTAEQASPTRRNPLADRHLVYFLIAMVPVVMVFFQNQAAMPLHLVHHLHMPPVAFGLMFTLNTVMVILIEVPLNAATSHWGHRRSLALGAFLVGAGYGGMMFAGGYVGVALTVVIWTFGEMIFLPTATTYIAEISPPARRGQYMGLFTMAFSIAFTIGPMLGAAVMERFGPTVLWAAAFGFGCLGAAMMSRVYVKGTALSLPRDS